MTEEKWTGTHNSIEIQWRCKTDTWAWNEFADSTHTFFLWLVVQADNCGRSRLRQGAVEKQRPAALGT